jgi:hypothetical protein
LHLDLTVFIINRRSKNIIFLCYKYSSLTMKIGKTKESKIGRILTPRLHEHTDNLTNYLQVFNTENKLVDSWQILLCRIRKTVNT